MAYFPTIAIGVPFFRAFDLIDPQAQAFYDRVIADGGANTVVPTGLVGLSATFKAVKAIYGVTDITQALSVFYDAHYLAYKKGTGTGATAGRAIEKLYSACGASGDCVQTTLASQPLLLEHSGTNYVYLSGVAGNYFSTPNVSANQLTGNFGLQININHLTIAGSQAYFSKYVTSGSAFGFILRLTSNNLQLVLNQGGTDFTYTSSIGINYTANQNIWIRASRNSTTGIIKFFTSSDGITYTQLGVNVTGITGNLSNPSITLNLGAVNNGAASPFSGQIFSASIFKDDTFTTPTQIFNPQDYNASVSQSTWTSSTGEIWTRNRDVLTTGLKASIVDYTMLMTNGTSHAMQAASFNLNAAAFTNYTTFAKFNNSVLSILSELGVDADIASGYYHGINGVPSTETTSINGNVGNNSSVWAQNSLLLKQSIQIGDTTLPNPETRYYINNFLATLSAAGGTSNNTANMNGTALNLFARNNGASLFFNGSFRNLLLAKQSDDTTVRTNVYNLIRTNYNNAF
jgi:hypothetical protein